MTLKWKRPRMLVAALERSIRLLIDYFTREPLFFSVISSVTPLNHDRFLLNF
jgi:hypothetical protein